MNTTSTPGRTPFESFDDAMVGELRQVVLARGEAPQQHRRRPAAVVASVAAVTVAAFGISTLGTSAAFAVERTGGGDIRIAIHRLDDANSLEKKLAEYGIDADVDYRPTESTPSLPVGPDGAPEGMQQIEPGGTAPQGSGSAVTVEGSAGVQSHEAAGEGPASACGDFANMPLTAELEGDDYVITIPKGSALTDADSELRITTSGELADSVAGIEVDYVVDGVSCGFGSMSASAGMVPAS